MAEKEEKKIEHQEKQDQKEKPQKKQNNQKNNKVVYVQKGQELPEEKKEEKTEEIGEKKQNYQKKKQYPSYKSKQPKFQPSDITLETVIPEIPKPADRLKLPDENKFHEEMDALDAQIDQQWQQYEKVKQDLKKQLQAARKQSVDKGGKESDAKLENPIYEVYSEKRKQWQAVLQQYKEVKAEFDNKKNEINDNYEKAQKYRQKMKIVMSSDELASEIAYLKDQQLTGKITIKEENQILKRIEELEKSFPFAAPLDELTKEEDSLKKEKKIIGQKLNQAWEKQNGARKDLDYYENEISKQKELRSKEKTERDKEKEAKQSKKDTVQLEIEAKRKETIDAVNALKEKKANVKKTYNKAWDLYEEQQDLIKHVEWLKKIKTRLQKEAQYAKLEDDKKRQEEIEKKSLNIKPYQEQLDLLELLIRYCENIKPKTKDAVELGINKEEVYKKIEEKVSNDWKKEQLTVVKSKKDKEDDLYTGKKKKQMQQKKQEPKKTQPIPLNHKLDVIGYFDSLKLMPPTFESNIDGTIEQLKEKKKYYESLDETKQEIEKTEQKTESKQHEKKTTKDQKNLDFNDQEFPQME